MNDHRVLIETPLDVKCPHCGAGLYMWCADSSGRGRPTLQHAARRRAFVAARNRARTAGLLIDQESDSRRNA